MRKCFVLLLVQLVALTMQAQNGLKKVYNEEINPIEQIDQAISKVRTSGKYVLCQVGGNWCPWCLRFADFVTSDSTISQLIADNFEYIHVNYNPRKIGGETQQRQAAALMERLDNCGRFGFPVFVVLDEDGAVIHIQDSSFLEGKEPEPGETSVEGEQALGYSKKKVLRFLKNWIPAAVKPVTDKR